MQKIFAISDVTKSYIASVLVLLIALECIAMVFIYSVHIPSERLVEYESAAHDLPMMDHEIAIISAAQKDDPHALSALHEILASRPNGLGMYDIHISASDEATVTADVSVVGGNADLLQTFRDNMEQSGVFHGLRIKAVENDAVHGQTVILSAWRDKQ
ncbi:MAG: hypothetical protein ACFN1I_00835 [Selenomonas artemidis]|jgi:hypothetical protein